MTMRSILFSAVLAIAAPLAIAVPAGAAPMHGGGMMGHDIYHDHGHRPPMRVEHRPPMPHGGHYRWRAGSWAWRNGVWVWAPGIWIRF